MPCPAKGCVFLLLPSLQAKGLCADIISAAVFDLSDHAGSNNHAQLLLSGFLIRHFHNIVAWREEEQRRDRNRACRPSHRTETE